jgi:hypothetical protein
VTETCSTRVKTDVLKVVLKTVIHYNETAVAIIAIVPDDGPMWPKHVVLE